MSFLIENLLKPDNVERRDRKKGTTNIHPAFHKTTELKRIERIDLNDDPFDEDVDSVDDTKDSMEDSNSMQDQCLKRRTLFTRQQTWQLEQTFRRQPYLTPQQCKALAEKINVTPTQIKIWFQNHRYKVKKCMKDAIQRAQYEHELRELHKYARPYMRPYSGYSSSLTASSPSYSHNYSHNHYRSSHGSYHNSTDKISSPIGSSTSPNSNYPSSNRTVTYSCQCPACCLSK